MPLHCFRSIQFLDTTGSRTEAVHWGAVAHAGYRCGQPGRDRLQRLAGSPSALSVSLVLWHAVLPKDRWRADRELHNLDWPMGGLPRMIHVDNGKDLVAVDQRQVSPHSPPVALSKSTFLPNGCTLTRFEAHPTAPKSRGLRQLGNKGG